MKVFFKVKGSASDIFSVGSIEAATEEEALKKLDEMYHITRDKNGNQSDEDLTSLHVITEQEFNGIEQDNGKEFTHEI